MSIMTTLPEIRKGRLITELDEAIASTVKACLETGKAGSVTIKLKFSPVGDTVALLDDISNTQPQPDKKATTFYATEDGQLSRVNPRQTELPFSAVDESETDSAVNE